MVQSESKQQAVFTLSLISKIIVSAAPIVISLGALLFAAFNAIADIRTRQLVIELTIKENLLPRIDYMEEEYQDLKEEVNELKIELSSHQP